MFKIYFVNSAYEKNQVLMYDDTRYDDELKLGNPKLHIEVNTAGTLDFELPSTNVAYTRIIPMVTELHVIKDNQKTHDKHIWFGRVLTIDTDLYGIKTIHCEGGLAYLNDCIYYDKTVDMGSWSTPKTIGRAMFARYESPTLNESGAHVYGVSPQEASAVIANIMSGGSNYKENLNAPFKHLGRIAKYTDPDSNVPVYAWVNEPVVPAGDQTDEDYYFYEGNLNSTVQKQCGISNPNNMTAIDLISSMMSNAGGLFWVSKTPQYPKRTFGGADFGDAVYVMQLHMRRYYPAFNPREGQTIQLGENLVDLTITDDGTTFFTAVHPHGQLGDSGEDLTLGRRGDLTGTTAVNKRNWKIDPDHGVMYCPELVERYGMIIRDLDVGTTNMYEQLVGMGMSEIDKISLVSRTVDGSWTSGVRELTVKGIDLSLCNADYSSIELTDAVRVLAPRHGIDTYLNVTAIDYDLQNVENTVFTLNAIKTTNEITDASPSYGSNSISPSSGSSYVHPKHTEHDLGLYKFSNDNLGHVDSAVAVTKKDITALGIPGEDTNTTYKLVQYQDILGSLYAVFYPVVALKDSSGNHTKIVVPNVRINAQGKLLYNECYGNLQNTDKYASLGDILFTTPNFFVFSTYNICASFIVSYDELECIVNVHLWSNLNGYEHAEIFTTSELSIPNVKWTVLRSYPGAPEGFEKNTCVFRICVDQESMKKIRNVHGSVYLEYSTGYDGGIVESVQKTDSVDTYLQTFHNDHVVQTDVILSSSNASNVAFTGDYNDLSNKPAIPDISSKQDKSTAVTHSANTAVGSATKPVYVAANGVATAISHSINSDVPANAKFTDTTYNDATQSTHGLMTAADKKKLDGLDASRFMNLNNSAIVIYGAGGTAQWYRLGTLVSSGNFNTAIIRILSGDGANGHARQNSSFEIHIKDAWQSTETISAKACGVTVYRINCANAKVKVIPTAHNTYTVWAYLPWGYWNGDYAVYGKYKSWTSQRLTQPDEPEGTGADTAYYDQAFLTSTVAKATEATTLTDSGWVTCPLAVTGNTTYPTSASTIRVRKYGKMVKLEGRVKYAKAFNNGHNVATIPDGYRPESSIELIGVPSIGAGTEVLFYVGISAKGNIDFRPADSAGSATFNPAISYDFQATYFID
nr:MAG TPA: endopeptidase tail [Caudoviricetes sp.]